MEITTRDQHQDAAAGEGPQLPEISVSRTSTESRASKSSGKQPIKSAVEQPLSPRLDNPSRTSKSAPYWKWNRYNEGWKRAHNPEISWQIKWDGKCFQNGRVLIIDYISNEGLTSPGGKRHITIAAKECQTLEDLRKFYSDKTRIHGAALRVIHVQNATWATKFFLKKFNISHPSELVGMQGFNRWAQYERPRQRNGKISPNGRSWRAQTDPWRNVSRSAFGMDYLRPYSTSDPKHRHHSSVFGDKPLDAKIMHLNSYEDSHSPYGYDVSAQRMSVYIQRKLGTANAQVMPDSDVKNPYTKHLPQGTSTSREREECQGIVESLDNGNTIILFETSASLKLDDCLVQPRNDFESRWRRLSFFLRKEDVLDDCRLAAQCTNIIISDIFHALAVTWDIFLSAASDHVAILEDKIYENPADESRAPELWTNQAVWTKVNKIMTIHHDLVPEIQTHMKEIDDADNKSVEVDWLASTPAEFDRLSHSVSEDLVQPTDSLSDLMYKSVGIRDSRQSLQLSLSMWRLSWITFIFLPLTFIVSFFGMNVNILENFPNVGWYFLSAAVLMIFVLLLWYCVKHSLQRSRQTPFERGLYESLFNSLEEEYPELWTSGGAVPDVKPTGFVNRMKWRLLRKWFAPERTIDKKLYSSLAPGGDDAELGAWAGFKRYLLRQWLRQIRPHLEPGDPMELAEAGGSSTAVDSDHTEADAEAIGTLAKYSMPIVVADANPEAVQPIARFGLRPLTPFERGSPRNSEDRPSSRGSSGIMVEERNLSDSESDAAEGSSTRHSRDSYRRSR